MIEALLSFGKWIGISIFYLAMGTLLISFIEKHFNTPNNKDKWK
jgi:hypothetical protein